MTGSASVSNVAYNPADQMTAMTHDGLVETRQYNVLSQLTRITVAGQMDVEYRYSATQNNGQITQMKNWISGEEVNYTYDALGRLSAASTTGPEWGLSFGYDGFGNKVSQTVTKGSGPSMSVAVDGNNRVVGHTYDASGFTTPVTGTFTSLTWDSLGRLQSAVVSGGGTESYVYDPSNARVWWNNRFFLRGVGGEVLAVYDFNPATKTFTFVRRYAWFAGKMVGKKEDRLGTVQMGSRFYPYGEEWPATAQDDTKFATYWWDGATNLDYAMNRYYQSTLGRFLSPDPFRGSASKARSGSWNRYGYVEGDPANANDPSGLCRVFGNELVCEVEVVAYLPRHTGGGAGGGLYSHYAPQLMWDYSLEVQHAGLAFYFNQLYTYQYPYSASTPVPPSAINQLASKSDAPQALRTALDAMSGNCFGQVRQQGHDRARMKDLVGNLRFWDARAQNEGMLTQNLIVPGTQPHRLMDLQFGAHAYVLRDARNQISSNIVLKANFFASPRTEQNVTLIHEFLHVYWRLDDDALARQFGIYLRGDSSSARLTDWLKADCDRGKLRW